MKKTLFIHNTLANYRIPLFNTISDQVDVTFLFTEKQKAGEVYGTGSRYDDIKNAPVLFLEGNSRIERLREFARIDLSEYQNIVIPPLDDLQSVLISLYVVRHTTLDQTVILFWEKWVAPIKVQPVAKRLKNLLQVIAAKSILPRVNTFLASGSKNREFLLNCGVSADRIKIAYDASESFPVATGKHLRSELKIGDDRKIVLFLGRLIKRKGLHTLIEALAMIKTAKLDLIVCGDGPEMEEAVHLGKRLLGDHVHFVGAIDPHYTYEYYSQADVFVLPSYFERGIVEAWGLSVNEALSVGIPVVSTDAVGAAFDLIQDGVNGQVAHQNDIYDLSNAVQRTLTLNLKHVGKSLLPTARGNYRSMAEVFINMF